MDADVQVPKLLTPIETAETLRISYGTVRKLVATGELRAVWVGRQMRVPLAEVERLAAGSAVGVGAPTQIERSTT